ncbi:NrfD/PsrC family molybdoenzyme membrane anchor subunit [Azospirillum rugosum]|uniref:Molybdopterin-containing oxidoreductase family membrane subunit n=1 Tax=Azospirillum rugosum TaxID=416170 RepID=A0ABS4SJG0_9PROT|nr:NrfD/PsrC family molybdoenzyme membrane anchor subunit [Azospirillum rugosum]MBP2292625.1 molybdopterin-containing oxidoreductase family membrane subunit [Azospirillum rugosum]MDQ0526351.1 molybdopterin-containing oxidoreductase family membrane subunit [Azospirillum rugosum]
MTIAAERTQDDTKRVVEPGVTPMGVTAHVSDLVLEAPTPLWWWVGFGMSAGLLGLFVVAIGWLFIRGVGIWGIDWPVAWGFAIANYVWWVGMASGGTLISALFFLTRSEWRSATSRIAESMTVFCVACAGIMPIIHLGRWWYFYWLFPYPNTMALWPQFRSPLHWDFVAILVYVIGSLVFWYVGLIPDLATLRDRATRRWQRVLYGILALGWQGSSRHWREFKTLYLVLAALMAPLVVSIHSVVGLDFAGGLTPGWHETQFPPYFVFGAALSGFAVVLMLVIPLRRALELSGVITLRHVDVLARLLLTASLLLTYCYLLEVFMPFYRGERHEITVVLANFTGTYAPWYWAKIVLNSVVPQLLWFRAVRLNRPLLFVIAAGVVVGMWIERYVIVASSLHRNYSESSWFPFHPTVWDWATLAGSVGLFLTGFFLLLRVIPMVSMFEMRELLHKKRGPG